MSLPENFVYKRPKNLDLHVCTREDQFMKFVIGTDIFITNNRFTCSSCDEEINCMDLMYPFKQTMIMMCTTCMGKNKKIIGKSLKELIKKKYNQSQIQEFINIDKSFHKFQAKRSECESDFCTDCGKKDKNLVQIHFTIENMNIFLCETCFCYKKYFVESLTL